MNVGQLNGTKVAEPFSNKNDICFNIGPSTQLFVCSSRTNSRLCIKTCPTVIP